jgi:hypothetical protein
MHLPRPNLEHRDDPNEIVYSLIDRGKDGLRILATRFRGRYLRTTRCAGRGRGAPPPRHKCNDNWALIFPGNMPKKAARCVSGFGEMPWLSGAQSILLLRPKCPLCSTRGTVSVWGR